MVVTTKSPLNRHFRAVKGHSFLLLRAPKTLAMADIKIRPDKPKRPTCPTCSKPAWLCLCARIKTKRLENSISVTVLQHSLEKKHPLNSVRIAALGLRNVAVSIVSDVNVEAQFGIRLLESESEEGVESPLIARKVFDECPNGKSLGFVESSELSVSSDVNSVESDENQFQSLGFDQRITKQSDEKKLPNSGSKGDFVSEKNQFQSLSFDQNSGSVNEQITEQCDEKKLPNSGSNGDFVSEKNQFQSLSFDQNSGTPVSDKERHFEGEDIDHQIVEQRHKKKLPNWGSNTSHQGLETSSFDQNSGSVHQQTTQQRHEKTPPNSGPKPCHHQGDVITFCIRKQGAITSLSHVWAAENQTTTRNLNPILENRAAREALARGFAVRKLQNPSVRGKEFEIEVPRGSVLLFPSEEALGIEELKGLGFEAKNVVVLDGTWAKAKRMYAENSWLRLVPHVKLETEKASLYEGVRMQPRGGCLSTIESLICALKAFGEEDVEGLEGLLDVFESMVDDQRQCKEKRLKNASIF